MNQTERINVYKFNCSSLLTNHVWDLITYSLCGAKESLHLLKFTISMGYYLALFWNKFTVITDVNRSLGPDIYWLSQSRVWQPSQQSSWLMPDWQCHAKAVLVYSKHPHNVKENNRLILRYLKTWKSVSPEHFKNLSSSVTKVIKGDMKRDTYKG